MKRSTSIRAAVAAAVLAGAAISAVPASADTPGYLDLVCVGSVPGGLTLNGGPRNYAMNCFGVLATTDTSIDGSVRCDFLGNDAIGTYAQSQGTFVPNCLTPQGEALGNGAYVRVGAYMEMTGNFGGPITGSFSGICEWVPVPTVGAVPPAVNGFEAHCHLVIT
jgi:hypothetical protein